jgi:hypothetical protein
MKKYCRFLIGLISKGLVLGSDLSIDPQMEDTNLQDEQTRDIQFEEDKNLQQEKSNDFEMDPR